jgi:hypothetical protein
MLLCPTKVNVQNNNTEPYYKSHEDGVVNMSKYINIHRLHLLSRNLNLNLRKQK